MQLLYPMDILQKLSDVQYQFLCDNGDLCKGPSEYCSSSFKECRPCSAEICQQRDGEDFPLQCNISCIITDALDFASRTTHFTDAVTVTAKDLTETSISGQSDTCVLVWPFILMTFVTTVLLLILLKVVIFKRCQQLLKKKLTCKNRNENPQLRDCNEEESEINLLSTGVTQLDVTSETAVKKVVSTHYGDVASSAGVTQLDVISETAEKKVVSTHYEEAADSTEVRPVHNGTHESKLGLNTSILAKAPTLSMSTFENDRTIVGVH